MVSGETSRGLASESESESERGSGGCVAMAIAVAELAGAARFAELLEQHRAEAQRILCAYNEAARELMLLDAPAQLVDAAWSRACARIESLRQRFTHACLEERAA